MIPAFARDGNLPPGIHFAQWNEVATRFGGDASNRRRESLIQGLALLLLDLRAAGCALAFIDGSFVTREKWPNDFDVCYDPKGMTLELLTPELRDSTGRRAAQKARYGGEALLETALFSWDGHTVLDQFQRDRKTRTRKGIVAIVLDDAAQGEIEAWQRAQALQFNPTEVRNDD